MDQNWFYLIEQASDISKIIFSFIIYACCLNKTTKTINKLTNEQPSSHFFLTDPLFYIKFNINLSIDVVILYYVYFTSMFKGKVWFQIQLIRKWLHFLALKNNFSKKLVKKIFPPQSEAEHVLMMFLFFWRFQPGCSYKRCSYKKKCTYVLIFD